MRGCGGTLVVAVVHAQLWVDRLAGTSDVIDGWGRIAVRATMRCGVSTALALSVVVLAAPFAAPSSARAALLGDQPVDLRRPNVWWR